MVSPVDVNDQCRSTGKRYSGSMSSEIDGSSQAKSFAIAVYTSLEVTPAAVDHPVLSFGEETDVSFALNCLKILR